MMALRRLRRLLLKDPVKAELFALDSKLQIARFPVRKAGLGSPLPHLHGDRAHPCHICTGTGLMLRSRNPEAATRRGTLHILHFLGYSEYSVGAATAAGLLPVGADVQFVRHKRRHVAAGAAPVASLCLPQRFVRTLPFGSKAIRNSGVLWVLYEHN